MFRAPCSLFITSCVLACSVCIGSCAHVDGQQKLVRREVVDGSGDSSAQYSVDANDLGPNTRAGRTLRRLHLSTWHGHHDRVFVQGWSGGRLANNLAQLMHAIIYAEAEGYETVLTPSERGYVQQLFDIPTFFRIDENPDVQKRVFCRPNKCRQRNYFYWCQCVNATRADFRRVFMKYLKPRLNNATRTACAAEGHGFSGLTIHLRSGDLVVGKEKALLAAPQGHFLPCSFHDAAIAAGGYKDVRVITEPDLAHPCLEPLQQKYPNIMVQSRSIQEDACALMTAHNLQYGISTFAFAMSAMNENVKSIAMPGEGNGEPSIAGGVGMAHDLWGLLGDCRKDDSARTIVYKLYNVTGGIKTRYGQDKVDWMRSTPASSFNTTTLCEKL